MKYYKNAELAKLYNVSEKSVRNWIDSARQGKLSLDLYRTGERVFIADNLHNSTQLAKLVEKGRKYRNQRSHKRLTPKREFYETYSHAQILDICHDLEIHRELAMKYRYFNEGGIYWDKYLVKLSDAGPGNLLTNTIEALDLSLPYLDALTQPFKYVNIVNICVGNSAALKKVVSHFHSKKSLKRFVAIDLSETMLDITEKRMDDWFDSKLRTEKYLRDIGHQRFQDILGQDTFGEDASETVNLVLFLVGPIVNFRDPNEALRTIHDSLDKNDILITSLKRDTPESRRFFDFNVNANEGLMNAHDRYLLDLLNIDDSCFEVEQFFDEKKLVRVQQIRLKLDITLEINSGRFSKDLHLFKGEPILIWRSWHHSESSIIDRFTRAGFKLEGFTKSKDNQLMLVAVKIDSDTHSSSITNPYAAPPPQ